jgi:adenylate cyclase
MNIYDNYASTIREAIEYDRRSKNLMKGGLSTGPQSNNFEVRSLLANQADLTPLASLQSFITDQGLQPRVNQRLGEHPDFKHLRTTNGTERHYIVSVFIDIKGSTNLFKEYGPETILVITNTIQRAAIHTCVALGGYIHRLQGDGLFAYFGGKGIDKKDAVLKAITACSMFTYFVKNDLKRIFDQDGVEDIATRIGIDFGDDDKVIWAKAGIGDCSEITTYSLHTNLASKMQGWAKANGIVVGDFIKDKSMLDAGLFSLVTDSKGDVSRRYIFEDRKSGFYYTQHEFDWLKYLKSLPYIIDENETLRYKSKSELERERLTKLRNTAAIIGSGGAYTDTKGNISSIDTGIKNQPHRFHYEG